MAVTANNQTYKPTGDDFFNTKVQTNKAAARCNMPCHTVTCSATVIGGGASGGNKVLTAITYYMKKEGKAWIEKYLTSSLGDTKDTKNLKMASQGVIIKCSIINLI